MFLVLRYKKLAFQRNHQRGICVGDVNSYFNGKSEWEKVRNFKFCVIITRYTGFVQGVPLKTSLFLDFAVQAGWL
jgi:hypothetical protein